MSKYGAFSGPYFPAFGLNAERYAVSLCIQSKCKKIRTRKNIRILTLLCIKINLRNSQIWSSQKVPVINFSFRLCYGLFLTISSKKYFHSNCFLKSRTTSVNPSRYENKERTPVKSCLIVALMGLIVLGLKILWCL